MNIFLLNEKFESIELIDYFQSFIWADRFREIGDFELYVSTDNKAINDVESDMYMFLDESPKLMIVEGKEVQSDPEQGSFWIITGRSLESILTRRIVWGKVAVSGNLQNAVKKLINDSIINPSMDSRKISNFKFKDSDDPAITSLTIDETLEYNGEELYTAVAEICENKHIGFKVTLDEEFNFVFELYAGVDRSYDQEENPYVVFSPKYDNLFNSNYFESTKDYKNVAWAFASEGDSQISAYVGDTSGLKRREIAVSTSVSQDTADKTSFLKQKANEELSKNPITKKFEGEVDSQMLYIYGRDYTLGDVVQLRNEYGQEGSARVEEMVFSFDTSSGTTRIPTFSSTEEENS